MTNRQRRKVFLLCPIVGGVIYWFDPRHVPTITGALLTMAMTAVLYAALIVAAGWVTGRGK